MGSLHVDQDSENTNELAQIGSLVKAPTFQGFSKPAGHPRSLVLLCKCLACGRVEQGPVLDPFGSPLSSLLFTPREAEDLQKSTHLVLRVFQCEVSICAPWRFTTRWRRVFGAPKNLRLGRPGRAFITPSERREPKTDRPPAQTDPWWFPAIRFLSFLAF